MLLLAVFIGQSIDCPFIRRCSTFATRPADPLLLSSRSFFTAVTGHADTGVHRALFFEYRDFQTRAINLWKEIARRNSGNTWIAGWNILNEPTDPEQTRIVGESKFVAFPFRSEIFERKGEPAFESLFNASLFFDGADFPLLFPISS